MENEENQKIETYTEDEATAYAVIAVHTLFTSANKPVNEKIIKDEMKIMFDIYKKEDVEKISNDILIFKILRIFCINIHKTYYFT